MLKINNNEYKVLTFELKFADSTYNSKKGYSVFVSLYIALIKLEYKGLLNIS